MGYDGDLPCPEINDLDEQRLNPCYNGMTMESYGLEMQYLQHCLNPCYNGMTIEHGSKTAFDKRNSS